MKIMERFWWTYEDIWRFSWIRKEEMLEDLQNEAIDQICSICIDLYAMKVGYGVWTTTQLTNVVLDVCIQKLSKMRVMDQRVPRTIKSWEAFWSYLYIREKNMKIFERILNRLSKGVQSLRDSNSVD